MPQVFTQDEAMEFINQRFAMLMFCSPLRYFDFENDRVLSTAKFRKTLAEYISLHPLDGRPKQMSAFRRWIGDCRRREIANYSELDAARLKEERAEGKSAEKGSE